MSGVRGLAAFFMFAIAGLRAVAVRDVGGMLAELRGIGVRAGWGTVAQGRRLDN